MSTLFPTSFHRACDAWHRQAQRTWGRRFLGRRLRTRVAGGTEATGQSDYTAGNDFRYVDWHRCARHDELVSRQFQGTEDHTVYFLLDCSASMTTGEHKFDLARQLTAALAHLAVANHDRVVVAAFVDRVVASLTIARKRGALPRLFRFLDSLETSAAASDFKASVEDFLSQNIHRGLTVVVSDLLDPYSGRPTARPLNGVAASLDLLRLRGYEPFVVQTFSQADVDPTDVGRVQLADIESGNSRSATITADDQRNYAAVFADFAARVRAYCHRYGLGITQVIAPAGVPETLERIFRGSAQRMNTRAGALMVFHSPMLLLFALAAAAVVLAYIHWARRRQQAVATLPLWEAALAKRTWWTRWQWAVSLAAAVGIVFLLTLALAGPLLSFAKNKARTIVLVVDTSASMNATDVEPTRLHAALEEALALADSVGPHEQMAIFTASSQIDVACGLTGDRKLLRQTILNIRPTDGTSGLAPAIRTAQRLLVGRQNGSIYVCTDGADDSLKQFTDDEQVNFLLHSTPQADNVAITQLSARPAFSEDGVVELFIEATNASDNKVETTATIQVGERQFTEIPLKMAAGESLGEVVSIPVTEPRHVRVQVAADDLLPTDNAAAMVIQPRKQHFVLDHGGWPDLSAAVRQLPNVTVDPFKAELWFAGQVRNFFGGKGVAFSPRGEERDLESPEIGWQAPWLQHVGLEEVFIDRANILTPDTPYIPLLQTPQGENLAVELLSLGENLILFGFAIEDTDLAGRPEFPRLLQALLLHLTKEDPHAVQFARRTSEHFILPTAANERSLTSPHGVKTTVAADKSHAVTLADAGHWRLTSDDESAVLSANLLDAAESDLRPREGLAGAELKAGGPRWDGSLWSWLIGLAIVAVIAHWVLLQREVLV